MTTPAPYPFCFPAEDQVAFEDRLTGALWDAFPVSEGHLLIVPRRHVPTWFDASEEGRAAITRVIGDVADPRGGVRHVIAAMGNYLNGK